MSRKLGFRFLLYFFIALILFVALLPTLISTDWGRRNAQTLLNKMIPGTLEVESLNLSWFGSQHAESLTLYAPDHTQVLQLEEVSLKTPLLILALGQKRFDEIQLKDLNANISRDLSGKTNLEGALGIQSEELALISSLKVRHVHAELSGNLIHLKGATERNGKSGQFEIDGWKSGDDFSIQVKLSHFPAEMIDMFSKTDLSPLFGPTLDAAANVTLKRMDGVARGSIQGENGYVNLDGIVTDGVLTLTRPFEAEVTPTPELGHNFLPDVARFFGDFTQKEKPVHIRIDSKGFSCPIQHFDVADLQVANATIDLGQIAFVNNGRLKSALKVLNPNQPEHLEIWFTPLFLEMDRGTIRVKRADMLVMNRYPIALWGKIDLIKDKLNMKIGVTHEAIQQATGAGGNGNGMIQLPLKGPIKNPSLDKQFLVAKMAALAVQDSILPGEGIVEKAFDAVTNSKVPPPTTYPFPWESKTKPKKTVFNEEKQQKSTKKKDVIKEVKKEAGKLLDKIFR